MEREDGAGDHCLPDRCELGAGILAYVYQSIMFTFVSISILYGSATGFRHPIDVFEEQKECLHKYIQALVDRVPIASRRLQLLVVFRTESLVSQGQQNG